MQLFHGVTAILDGIGNPIFSIEAKQSGEPCPFKEACCKDIRDMAGLHPLFPVIGRIRQDFYSNVVKYHSYILVIDAPSAFNRVSIF